MFFTSTEAWTGKINLKKWDSSECRMQRLRQPWATESNIASTFRIEEAETVVIHLSEKGDINIPICKKP
jgi:hypothetical protein